MLARLRRRYANDPEGERRALLMVALQREQVVTVAYREDAVARRVAVLPVDEGLRQLIRQCLVWIWKDEEVHSTYMRGYLLRKGLTLASVVVFGRQLYGAMSGWVTATRELTSSADAPVRSVAARLMIGGGRVMGLVPPAVARELGYGSFRHYCELNAVLERTAELAYGRFVEIAPSDEERDLFARVKDDEGRHADAFQLIADAFDDNDHQHPDMSLDDLHAHLAAISPWFVPASRRPSVTSRGRSAFGRPFPVHVRGGSREADVADSVAGALDAVGLASLLTVLGGRVAIRTSFMLGYDRRDMSNVVSPSVLAEVAAHARRLGASDVAVIEAPTVYERYYQHRSVAEVAAYFGYDSPGYRIVDAGGDQVPLTYQRGLQQNTISRTWLDADVRIVLAKLRTDPNEFGHLCLSSLEGMASQIADTVYAARAVEFRTATMMLLDAAPPDLAMVDAWGPIADGPVGVMGCRRPATAWRVYAGRDALSVDRAVLADMGLADASRVPIIRRAMHWFGVELAPVEVHGSPGAFSGGFRGPWSHPLWRAFAALSYPVYVYMSGQGQLFVPEMDIAAFPPVEDVGWPVRAVRRGVQMAFSLRPGPK